jgi:predicted lipid carrier protein YhbT
MPLPQFDLSRLPKLPTRADLPKLPKLPAPPNVPEFTLPALLARVGGKLPQWPHSAVIALALNFASRFEMLPADTLAELEGKHFRIHVSDLGSVADFEFSAGKFRPLIAERGEPDLSFSAKLAAYLQLVTQQEDPDTLFFNRRLNIEGDTELGLRVKNMLDAIDTSTVFAPRRH